jgi:hypothetical protein
MAMAGLWRCSKERSKAAFQCGAADFRRFCADGRAASFDLRAVGGDSNAVRVDLLAVGVDFRAVRVGATRSRKKENPKSPNPLISLDPRGLLELIRAYWSLFGLVPAQRENKRLACPPGKGDGGVGAASAPALFTM